MQTNRTEDAASYADQMERFRTLFEQSLSFAAVLVGPAHRFLLTNPAYERLVSGRDVIGLTVAEALPDLVDQEFVKLLDRVFTSGEAHVGRNVPVSLSRGSSGAPQEYRLDFVYQPIRNTEGEVTAIFVEGTDVTDRFTANQALHDSEERHRQILDSAIDYAIIATNLDGRITRWNRGAEQILGWTEQEMLGHAVERIVPPEARAAGGMSTELERALATGRGTGEGWRVRKSGERFWAHGEMTPLRDDQGRATGFVKVLRDRTEEHRVAGALRASEDRLRRAQEAGGIGIFAVNIAERVVEPSPEFCRIFGLEPCGLISTSELEALIVPEDAANASDDARRRSGEMPLVSEYRIRRANDGEMRVIARRAEFECDADGQKVRLLGVVQDVTEQRLAQVAVAASEARFRAFTEAVPNQVWSATPDGRLDWANQRTFDYDGADQRRLDEHGWETQVHPGDIERASETWSRALTTGEPYVTEFRLRRSDGEYRWHIARAVALRNDDGRVERWIGTNTDIQDERRARDELAQLNATLEERVEERTRERDRAWKNSSDLQAVIEEDGTFRAVSDAWMEVLGWRADEIVGRSYLDFVHPDDCFASEQALATAAVGTLPAYENRCRHRDGGWRWISWVAAPEQGLIYASGRHVTAEKETATALDAAQEQLRQAQKMEAVGQLTGGVAHDFNNLLTVIRGSVDLLRRENVTPERRARYLDAIGETADRAAKLTGQLLAFARRQSLKPELFDAGVSLREVAGMMHTLTGSRITMEVLVPDDHCFILADRSQFDTAIINMGINARDAMAGEGKLTIATGPVSGIPPLRGHAAVAGDFVAITIADNGSGIDPADVDRIFEPFFTTKPVGEGTGLGLSQVIGFAKQSGGDIRVDSRIGEGTTFTLYLPRSHDDQGEAFVKEEAGPIDGEGICVLVVEDNEQVGEFATSALKELGYETVLATDAKAALERLGDNADTFQVVFSDVVMPGMSGLELGQEIRRRGLNVAVVLTSGYSHVLAQNGAHGFELLHKPYSVEQLTRVLRKAAAWNANQMRAPR